MPFDWDDFSFDNDGVAEDDADENPYDIHVQGLGRCEYVLTMAIDPRSHWGKVKPGEGDHVYLNGEVVAVEAVPWNNRWFSGWIGDVSDARALKTTMPMDTSKTVTASFKWVIHKLTMNVEPEIGGTVTPAAGVHHLVENTIVPLSARAAPGYEFSGWIGPVKYPDSTDTPLLLTEELTVTALFSPVQGCSPPPGLAQIFPAHSSLNVPCNTAIQLLATDELFGVDIGTLDVTVKGESIITAGAADSAGVEIIPHGLNCSVYYQPRFDFEPGDTVDVHVHVCHLGTPAAACDSAFWFVVGRSGPGHHAIGQGPDRSRGWRALQ